MWKMPPGKYLIAVLFAVLPPSSWNTSQHTNTFTHTHFDINTRATSDGRSSLQMKTLRVCLTTQHDTVSPAVLWLWSDPYVSHCLTPLAALLTQTALPSPAQRRSAKPDANTRVREQMYITQQYLRLSRGNLRISMDAALSGKNRDVCFSWRCVRVGGLCMCAIRWYLEGRL